MYPVSSIYAGALSVLLIILSARVILARRRHRVGLGDGDHELLRRRIRAQGNFAEYAPLGLLLLVLSEAGAAPAWWLHVVGATLLVGRVVHGWALGSPENDGAARVGGMALTFTSLGLLGATCLVSASGILGI